MAIFVRATLGLATLWVGPRFLNRKLIRSRQYFDAGIL